MVGMTGKEIYDDFTNGVGSGSLSDAAAMVNEVAAKYGERAGRARWLIARMDAAWEGEAAGAARRGFGPVEVEHGLAGDALAVAQDLTNRQAGSFGDARNGVVPVPPEPVMPDPWAMLTTPGVARSYREQLTDYNAANQHNVDVMSGYTNASVYNANGLPRSFGRLAPDQAGMAIDSGTSDSSGGPNDGGPRSGDGSPDGGRSGGEWAGRGAGWEAPPPNDGGPSSPDSGAPPVGGGSGPVPQETTPGASVPVPGGPATRVPVDTGAVGSGPPAGGPGGGWTPGFGPVGSGPGGGPGGSGGRTGVPGSGSGPEVRGPGGRVGGEPHGPGGRLGAGPVAGGPAGEAHGGRGVAGAGAGRGGALGGMPLAGGGGRPRAAEDVERQAPHYLQEEDPEGLLGTDELTAPPVIGEEDSEPSEAPRAG